MKVNIKGILSLDDLDSVAIEDVSIINVYIGDTQYRINEEDGILQIHVDGKIVIYPRASNLIYVERREF